MNIVTLFTIEEKKEFLLKNGYNLVDYTDKTWEQWGNHDSQGEWIFQTYVVAIKDGEKPSSDKVFYKIFEKTVGEKFKQFILQSL